MRLSAVFLDRGVGMNCWPLALLALATAACTRPSPPSPTASNAVSTTGAHSAAKPLASAAPVASDSNSSPAEPAPAAQLDPDGNDDAQDAGQGSVPALGHFEKVGRSRLALQRICDLTPFGDALYGAHANQPLGTDGATITRYRPDDPNGGFTTAFDWNRPGERTTGGGAGQGFVRVHAIGGRLFVPDADPPYNGLGLAEHGTEGYVFVSDAEGKFAPARMPGHLPPLAPDPEGRAGAGVLPRAYHVLDVIRYRGRMIASTGSVPSKQQAWVGPSPGALHVANQDWSRWTFEIDYPFPWLDGVWRLTFLVRFKDRLYAGIQDYDGREPNDYVIFDPPAEATTLFREHVHPVRVTPGGAQTIRWYADKGRLYWIASAGDGVLLRVTQDGESWRVVDLPAVGGRPTDITRFRGALVVLAERALWKLADAGAVERVAEVVDKKSPFGLTDIFCAAPLAVFRNELYAGGQRDGSLFRLVEGEAPDAGRTMR